jgi:hypothetical protein
MAFQWLVDEKRLQEINDWLMKRPSTEQLELTKG